MMMKAFSKGITKAQMKAENKLHEKKDAFRQGIYFDRDKGCTVGCSIKSICNIKNITLSYSDHSLFEDHLGLPYWIAKLADSIFEGLSVNDAKKWTGRFINAVVEGSDVNSIKNEFLARVIESTFNSYDNIKFKKVKKAQEIVISGLRVGDKRKIAKGEKAASAAYAAVAASAPAAYAVAAVAAASAAYAADAAVAAVAHAAAASDARETSYLSISNILIELLESCEVVK
jgi:hypothetical protein